MEVLVYLGATLFSWLVLLVLPMVGLLSAIVALTGWKRYLRRRELYIVNYGSARAVPFEQFRLAKASFVQPPEGDLTFADPEAPFKKNELRL